MHAHAEDHELAIYRPVFPESLPWLHGPQLDEAVSRVPSSPFSMRVREARMAGSHLPFWLTASFTPPACAASTMRTASGYVIAMAFGPGCVFPARAAAMATSAAGAGEGDVHYFDIR